MTRSSLVPGDSRIVGETGEERRETGRSQEVRIPLDRRLAVDRLTVRREEYLALRILRSRLSSAVARNSARS